MRKATCRNDPEYTSPRCSWCFVKNQCLGPVIRQKGAYGIHNCPAEPDNGGIPVYMKYQECLYCRDSMTCKYQSK